MSGALSLRLIYEAGAVCPHCCRSCSWCSLPFLSSEWRFRFSRRTCIRGLVLAPSSSALLSRQPILSERLIPRVWPVITLSSRRKTCSHGRIVGSDGGGSLDLVSLRSLGGRVLARRRSLLDARSSAEPRALPSTWRDLGTGSLPAGKRGQGDPRGSAWRCLPHSALRRAAWDRARRVDEGFRLTSRS